jgi:hypothetical protein
MNVGPVRAALALVAGAAAIGLPAGAQTSSAEPSQELQTLLASAADYLDHYEHQFSAVMSDEVYDMISVQQRSGWATQEELRSDLVLLTVEKGEWVQFRDVYQVNGRPVRDHDRRLQTLLEKLSTDQMARVRQIDDENARYNIGVVRNINIPTLALGYLTRANQPRSSFSVAGHETNGAATGVEVSFRETARPSRIQSGNRDAITTGRFWIRGSSGEVLRTELKCEDNTSGLTSTIDVAYAPEPRLKLLVPVRMDEAYLKPDETDRGHATYSNFRQFSVDTKGIVGRGGGPAAPAQATRR